MQGPRKEVLTGERNDHQFGSVLAIGVASAELDQSADLDPDFVPRSKNQPAPPSDSQENLEDVTQLFQRVAAVVEALQGPALANACNELEQICAKARSNGVWARLSVAATGHDMESNAQPDASPRKGSCLSPLPMNLKVQNTFLVVMDDVLDEPAVHRRASSAPPACALRHDEGREAPQPPPPSHSPATATAQPQSRDSPAPAREQPSHSPAPAAAQPHLDSSEPQPSQSPGTARPQPSHSLVTAEPQPDIASPSEQNASEPKEAQTTRLWRPKDFVKMDAAALHKQAQTTRLAGAALRPGDDGADQSAMQHQVTMEPTATDGSFLDQMMWAWLPTAAAPQQWFQQDSMEKSAKGTQWAAALRAQARPEAVENYIQQELAASDVEELTSLMLRNIPLNLTRDMFVKLIDAEGFAGKYDFIYLPIDFKTSANLGYAFVNLTAHSHAVWMREKFQGFCRWGSGSVKQCAIEWSSTQGLAAYIYRYRNSHVMHESVPEEAKPRLFNQGVRVAFPAPTRRLKAFFRQEKSRICR